MYELQRGRCYYCGVQLGALGAQGAFVRDHLWPIRERYRTEADYLNFRNIALTCYSCNEAKGPRSETVYWSRLAIRHGEKWVATRQRAMHAVRQWREDWGKAMDEVRHKAEMAHLDEIVEADYQKKLAAKRRREERRQNRKRVTI